MYARLTTERLAAMSQFEFVFVLVSIVAGLALTRLLSGLSRSLTQPRKQIDLVHTAIAFAFTVGVFVVWWGMFRFKVIEDWNFTYYAVVMMYVSTYFVVASILYPQQASEVPRFSEIRVPLCVFLVILVGLEYPYLSIIGYWSDPWWYPYLAGFLAISVVACPLLRSETYDKFLALLWLSLWVGWGFLARFTIA